MQSDLSLFWSTQPSHITIHCWKSFVIFSGKEQQCNLLDFKPLIPPGRKYCSAASALVSTRDSIVRWQRYADISTDESSSTLRSFKAPGQDWVCPNIDLHVAFVLAGPHLFHDCLLYYVVNPEALPSKDNLVV